MKERQRSGIIVVIVIVNAEFDSLVYAAREAVLIEAF
ncbi:MAG: hypothetical protein JWN18_541 [Parcubacteria group bacterium]|nr:hypothetical protein [Parcubacteria group bacterium]